MDWSDEVFIARDGTKFVVSERLLSLMERNLDFPDVTGEVEDLVFGMVGRGEFTVVGVCAGHGESRFEDSDGSVICRDCGGFLSRG